MDRGKRSKLWLHFVKTEDKAKRNYCNKLICCKQGVPTNMTKHLRLVHRVVLKECTVSDSLHIPNADCPSIAGTSTSTITQNVVHETPFSLASKGKLTQEKTEECHRSITLLIVKGLHPFSVVDSPLFR